MSGATGKDLAQRLSQVPVPWDDVRQRRVLGRVEAAVQARTVAHRRGRWMIGAATGVAAAAAAAVVLALALPSAPLEEALTEPTIASAEVEPVASPSIPFAAWPELRLPDRSLAQLRHGARVDVDVQREDLVRLRQHGGEVRYEVAPDRARAFVVEVAGVEVRVVGTIFTVALSEDPQRIAVEVERGLVEVDSGARVAELGAGDRLSLELEGDGEDEDEDEDEEVVVLDAAEPAPTSRATRPASPSVEALLAEADAARARGELPRAAAALSELVRRYGDDPRAYSAYFQLGKVERARGRHTAAAAAFAKCWKRSPRGALAEDARAEAAVSWHAAGRDHEARAAAEGYLARHPGGTHRARMQSLLAELR
jgi:transmembrane sensor